MRPASQGLWVGAFGLASAFQIWRGAPGDAVIFASATALVFLDSSFTSERQTNQSQRWSLVLLFVAAAILLFAPLYSAVMQVTLIGVGIGSLYLAHQHRPHVLEGLALMRGRRWWTLLALAAAIWEVIAYFLADRTLDDDRFPTITVLVDPLLSTQLGKAIFISLWLIFGWSLVRVWSSDEHH